MTQAANFSVPLVGPVSPEDMASRIDDSFQAFLTQHFGTTRPTYAVAGTIWFKDTEQTPAVYELYAFDGTADILIGTLSPSAGTFVVGLPANSVGSSQIAANAVTAGKINAGAVSYAKLAAAAMASVAEWRADTASKLLTPNSVWGAMAEVTLTDAASIAWDMNSGFDFAVTLGGNRTMSNPTNKKVGQKGRLRIVQDGTGSRTLSWSSDFEFAGGAAPTLSTAASAEDVLYYDVISASRILITTGGLNIS